MQLADKIKQDILNDVRVELSDEFDRNFERKAFFSERWKRRARPYPKGSLLMVTGTMRRSIKASIADSGVRFTSSVPYAAVHNEGLQGSVMVKAHKRTRGDKTYNVRAHTRRVKMPRRQFVGDGPDTRRIIEKAVKDNVAKLDASLAALIRQKT
jgi:phage gpG-like protein